jgi:hypothetical protein
LYDEGIPAVDDDDDDFDLLSLPFDFDPVDILD